MWHCVCWCDTVHDDVTLCMMMWHCVCWCDTVYDDVTLCVLMWHCACGQAGGDANAAHPSVFKWTAMHLAAINDQACVCDDVTLCMMMWHCVWWCDTTWLPSVIRHVFMHVYDDVTCVWWCDTVWWCGTVYDDVTLCMMMWHCVWSGMCLCLLAHVFVPHLLFLWHCVWWCDTVCDDVTLWMMWHCVWWCDTVYDNVTLCMMMWHCVWWCDIVWWCDTVHDDVTQPDDRRRRWSCCTSMEANLIAVMLPDANTLKRQRPSIFTIW